METTVLSSDPRRLYSWWWDSHISPKNSKWLQDNLNDMDAKVKAMIKLIEEDADSFARRAEMYYKKRPELMKLVEQFYRAYRALAERYDHATAELRHAHRAMAQAYPDQVPYGLADESSPSGSSNDSQPRLLEIPDRVRLLLESDDFIKESREKCLKQLNEMFGLQNTETATKVEHEVEFIKKVLEDVRAEKETVVLEYQKSLQKLSSMESELSHAQNNAKGLDERACRAESEISLLKEELLKLETEKDVSFIQYNQSLEKISRLEGSMARAQEDKKRLTDRAIEAEIETQNLRKELSELHADKEDDLEKYTKCSEMVSLLEKNILLAEENAGILNKQTESAEADIRALKQALVELKEQKEAAAFQYKQSLETIGKMETEISYMQEDAKRLKSAVLLGVAKLKDVEENRDVLERSNQSLQKEADNLAKTIAMKDEECFDKQNKLEKLQMSLEHERSRFLEAESTLQSLQKLHSQSQEDQKALTLELQNRLQMLKHLELRSHDLQGDLKRIKEENHGLNELTSASTDSIKNLESEISSLKKLKEKLEEELALQMGLSNNLQQEIYRLKEELKALNLRYQSLIQQVHAVGLSPESLESSVRNLQNDNAELRESCRKDRDENEVLYEKNNILKNSASELNAMLEESREKVKELQDSCQFCEEENSSLVAEKSILLSKLQIMTENMQKLLEKNALLETSLTGADADLEKLRTKSKSLENFCELLENEKSNLLQERGILVAQQKDVEQRLGSLERRFTNLEEKYVDLEKEKESALYEVDNLRSSFTAEQKLHSFCMQSSESRLTCLESNVHVLQEESKSRKQEFEEELDKAVNAQVEVFILQKFMEDLEGKNIALLTECRKHIETSKLSNKLISELETENLEQQVELEYLSDEIGKLRMAICKVFKALQCRVVVEEQDEKIGLDKIVLPRILYGIEDLKSSILAYDDEEQQLLVENSVFLAIIGELKAESVEFQSEKKKLEQELVHMREQHRVLLNEKDQLLEKNRQFTLRVSSAEQAEEEMKAELEIKESENGHLGNKVDELKEELQGVKHLNDQLNHQICLREDFLREKAIELMETDQNLKSTQNQNTEFCKTIEELKRECEESKLFNKIMKKTFVEQSKEVEHQKKEIDYLMEANKNLENEVGTLHMEILEHRNREENLSSELQEKSNEFELWEAEAASFYFDLQVSYIHEVLLEDKVHELNGVCERLEDESASKGAEMEKMKERIGTLEDQVGGLKAHLSAYVPVIASLRDNIASLERSSLLATTNLGEAEDQETTGASGRHIRCQEHTEKNNEVVADGIPDLLTMQARIKAVEKAVVERNAVQVKINKNRRPEHTIENEYCRFPKTKPEIPPPVRIGTLIKDIQLDHVADSSVYRTRGTVKRGGHDQMLELWEAIEDCNPDAAPVNGLKLQVEKELGIIDKQEAPASSLKSLNQEGEKGKMLEKLSSDTQRLTSLRATVQDLKKKIEVKRKSKKVGSLDYEKVNRQLQEAEEAVLRLIITNCQLKKEVKESSVALDDYMMSDLHDASSVHKKKVTEEAQRWSEKIGRLQFEVQSIHYVLLKLDDEKKSKGKDRFSQGKTGVLFKDLIYSSRRRSMKKKGGFCGCARPPINSD